MLAKKVKVTLSLEEDLVRRTKSKLALEGKNLSELVEELLAAYDGLELLDELCDSLNLEKKFCTSYEVEAGRPAGLKAEEVVREIRGGRAKRVLGH